MSDVTVKRGDKVEVLLTAGGKRASFVLRVRSKLVQNARLGQRKDISEMLRLGPNRVVFEIFPTTKQWKYKASIFVNGNNELDFSRSGKKSLTSAVREVIRIRKRP
jgi:hypothetical protein